MYLQFVDTESWRLERTMHKVWGHSMAQFQDKLIIFGGADDNVKVTNKLVVLDASESYVQ